MIPNKIFRYVIQDGFIKASIKLSATSNTSRFPPVTSLVTIIGHPPPPRSIPPSVPSATRTNDRWWSSACPARLRCSRHVLAPPRGGTCNPRHTGWPISAAGRFIPGTIDTRCPGSGDRKRATRLGCNLELIRPPHASRTQEWDGEPRRRVDGTDRSGTAEDI